MNNCFKNSNFLIKSKIIQEFRYFSRYFSADSRYFPIHSLDLAEHNAVQ